MTVELDKLDIHNRQQLSALMDGELSPDEARFLLRRLQHDEELATTWDRWQLCGDVLRGQAQAPAPADFAARVAQAIAAEPHVAAANAPVAASRGRLLRWGGGALAASVAFVALFMARQSVPQDEPVAVPAVAATAPAQINDGTAADAGGTAADAANAEQALASAAAASVAVASVPRRDASTRRGATRTQQAARASAVRASRQPERAVAQVNAPLPTATVAVAAATPSLGTRSGGNPFSATPANAPQARPWPRSVLSAYPSSANGALTTGYSSDSGARTFYPFDPALSPQPAQP